MPGPLPPGAQRVTGTGFGKSTVPGWREGVPGLQWAVLGQSPPRPCCLTPGASSSSVLSQSPESWNPNGDTRERESDYL